MLARKALAGTAGAPKEYVEDVFSTYLYKGTGANQTITNNIDISGKGGLVWTKERGTTGTSYHSFFDTERGTGKAVYSNTTGATDTKTDTLTAFTSSGFSLGADAAATTVNVNNANYVSWTFRQAKKFFDVVTYTGNGSAPRDISHNLGSSPGFIIIKRTDSTGDWWCWHRSTTNANANFYLNYTDGADSGANPMISAVSSTNFTLATNQNATMNINGATYVAYLFAHDAGGFGDAGDQSIIKCGSFTTNGSGTATVDLGWEPQWYLQKSEPAGSWWMTDNMRGFNTAGTVLLRPHLSDAEYTDGNDYLVPNATGFTAKYWSANTKFLYIAIRRGPMKTPTSGTSVFKPNTYTGTGADQTITGVGFAPDFILNKDRNVANANLLWDRMRGSSKYLVTSNTAAEATWDIGFDSMDGFRLIGGGTGVNASGGSYVHWFFRRAPGFFDVVCYTGDGASSRSITHNLGVKPEFIIVKRRSSTGYWATGHGTSGLLFALNTTNAGTSSTSTAGVSANGYVWIDDGTTTTFKVIAGDTDSTAVNASGSTYVAYLFASVSGVSKVGSYTGNGSSQTINCNFTNGARFILIKRTDSTGRWYVWDTARGITASTDPYLMLNDTAAEDAYGSFDAIDPDSSGFIVNQTTNVNINVDTATYIYLAIA